MIEECNYTWKVRLRWKVRTRINWNENWEFCKGELGENPEFEVVTLPHTWNAFDGQDGGNDYYQGVAWYQKTFLVDGEWKDIYVRFGAVSKMAEVWCNGNYVGKHCGGFSAFTVRLTPFLQEGANEILVKADNSNELPIYPHQADFTFFGGIYRDVELLCFDKEEHFDVATFGTDPVFIKPQIDGTVSVEAYAIGGKYALLQILDREGNCVAESEKTCSEATMQKEEKVELVVKVNDPHRWNGTKDAYLYEAKVALFDEANELLDEMSSKFGFREFAVTPDKGFFLNGVSYPLRGVCRHQDREDMGWAITEKEQYEDMSLIREIGANTVRLAHYQHASFFYDLCDQNGMVVWAEIPFISVYDTRKEADENLISQMRELVLQNYNHPSICFWGIANEVGIGGETEQMYEILRKLNQLTKELDASRLTVIANVGMTKTSSPLFHITDVASYNEYKGWYEGTREDHGAFCDERHGEIPDVPLAISEYGADSVLTWHSEEPKLKDYTEEYQALVHEAAEASFEERPYIWATWLWNMFDFAADARDEGGCKGRNNKGLVTYDRRVKKQGFYFYKACWSKEPFVYLCGKRFKKHAADKITVKVYSNQNQVELIVNGRHVETLCGKTIFEFKNVSLQQRYNEVLVKTPEGLQDSMVLEKVATYPEEYIWKEEKRYSENVKQWFADIKAQKDVNKELVVQEGYLSVMDSMEEIYRYPEGYRAVQELIATPLAIDNPAIAKQMATGGALSFHSIWRHISKLLPDEAYYLLNERLSKIKK